MVKTTYRRRSVKRAQTSRGIRIYVSFKKLFFGNGKIILAKADAAVAPAARAGQCVCRGNRGRDTHPRALGVGGRARWRIPRSINWPSRGGHHSINVSIKFNLYPTTLGRISIDQRQCLAVSRAYTPTAHHCAAQRYNTDELRHNIEQSHTANKTMTNPSPRPSPAT